MMHARSAQCGAATGVAFTQTPACAAARANARLASLLTQSRHCPAAHAPPLQAIGSAGCLAAAAGNSQLNVRATFPTCAAAAPARQRVSLRASAAFGSAGDAWPGTSGDGTGVRAPLLQRLSHAVTDALAPVVRYWEIIRRFAVTLLMLAFIRAGHYIPLPGVDLHQVSSRLSAAPNNSALMRFVLCLCKTATVYVQAHVLSGCLHHKRRLLPIAPVCTLASRWHKLRAEMVHHMAYADMLISCCCGGGTADSSPRRAACPGGRANDAGAVWPNFRAACQPVPAGYRALPHRWHPGAPLCCVMQYGCLVICSKRLWSGATWTLLSGAKLVSCT